MLAKSTLFIGGIHPSTTNEQLMELFSSHGPVKSAFVVKNDGQKNKKFSCGFVHFALADDASKAQKELNGHVLNKHKISVEFAKHRERSGKDHKVVEDPNNVEDVGQRDGVQIKIESTNEDRADKANLIKRMREKKDFTRTVIIAGLSHVQYRKALFKKVKKSGSVTKLIFPAEINNGNQLVENNDIAFAQFSSVLEAKKACKSLDKHIFKGKEIRACIHPLPNEAKRDSRVVVRNLKFTWSIADIMSKFASKPLFEITVPTKGQVEGGEEEQNSGFCFITFGSKEIATEVMEEFNGKVLPNVKRMLIIDFVKPKDLYQSMNPKPLDHGENEAGDVDDDAEVEHLEEDFETASDVSMVEEVEEEEKKVQRPDEDYQKVVFVRNLPFGASEEEIKEKFEEFGRVKYARIVMDKQTNLPKGTAFVCFYSSEDAQHLLLKQQELIGQSLSINQEPMNVNLLPESSTMISLQGRPLFVLPALSRNDLTSNNEVNASKNSSIQPQSERDKRNLYLVKEMLFSQKDEEIYSKLSQTFLDGLKELYDSRVKKLKKHLYFSVSRTRLSLRHLGKAVNEQQLKSTAIDSIKSFQKQLKESGNQREIDLWKSQGLFQKIAIKQAKVVRDKVAKKSLGYAFLEFTTHAHALACLRWLKSKPMEKRWVVEFAIENSIVMKKRASRDLKRAAEQKAEDEEDEKKKKQKVKSKSKREVKVKGEKRKNVDEKKPTKKLKVKHEK